jgi:hypothetical protein
VSSNNMLAAVLESLLSSAPVDARTKKWATMASIIASFILAALMLVAYAVMLRHLSDQTGTWALAFTFALGSSVVPVLLVVFWVAPNLARDWVLKRRHQA